MTEVPKIGMFGASGSGKTSHAIALLSGLKENRVMIFDPLKEFKHLKGYTAFTKLNPLKDHVKKHFGNFKVRYCPPRGTEPQALNLFAGLAEIIQDPYMDDPNAPKLWFVADELHLGYGLHGDTLAPNFGNLCTHGRHLSIAMMCMSQRCAQVGTRWRAQVITAVIFRQKGAADLNATSSLSGIPIDRIQKLVNHEYLSERYGTITHGKTKKLPKNSLIV